MKISLDNEEVFSLSEVQKKVIQNDIPADIFEADMKRRLEWCLEHPVRRHCDRMRPEWIQQAKAKGAKEIPIDTLKIPGMFADLSPYREFCIQVDGVECYKLSKEQHAVLCNCICKECTPEDWMKNRMQWVLKHKYERCMERLRKEWEPRLQAKGVESVPADDDEFAMLIFMQADYKSRSYRELESKASLKALAPAR